MPRGGVFGQQGSLPRAGQKFIFTLPYYSTVRFTWAISGAGPYTYTLSSTKVRAFAYKIGDVPTIAGYSATFTAQASETNLLQANQTNSAEDVYVVGIAAMLEAWSDARLASIVWPNVYVELALNGSSNIFRLGTLGMMPGAGGLQGTGKDDLGTQALGGGRPLFGYVHNGWPDQGNFFRMPEGLVWKKNSMRDSMLNLICTPAEGRTLTATAPADEAGAAGVRGYAHPVPADNGPCIVDVKFVLRGAVEADRSDAQ